MAALLLGVAALIALLVPSSAMTYHTSNLPCLGTQSFRVTFDMMWTQARFGQSVPDNAVISPLTAFSHHMSVKPFASKILVDDAVETVAESGNNMPLIMQLRETPGVLRVAHLSMPTRNDGKAEVVVLANGYSNSLSAIAMLAPTPDWIVFVSDVKLCMDGKWAREVTGDLFAYDAGTEVTPGVDQSPRKTVMRILFGLYNTMPVGKVTLHNI